MASPTRSVSASPYDQIYASVACADQTVTGTVWQRLPPCHPLPRTSRSTPAPGVSATTNANGEFSFDVPAGVGYCVRIDESTLPPGRRRRSAGRPWRVVASGSADNYDAAPTAPHQPDGLLQWSRKRSYDARSPQPTPVQPDAVRRVTSTVSDTGFDFVIRFQC